ncbi:prepilin peptidase [Pseudomonas sp. LPB0260]|uniref:A24 family peptidase n=1 Tax=Pseudomonas sp. LPB0260 TaxID=2614442 RepID=UPI0015C1D0AD|nr:prepilin peptidase [Pseudomonas sp. LPB0260]QLC72160.1 prepilin peptidase [Pseudomonas sp. LPB0260]QLC74938.1 prepilin peptidase [Pseudomonas sp. LPB0260]
MLMEQMLPAILLIGLLSIAVASDLRRHRIPNLLVLSGLVTGLVGQFLWGGGGALGDGVLGMLVGLGMFLPLYALGAMAAGDVKLMAMVGAFLSPLDALWAALFSLVAGGICGLLIVLVRGELLRTYSRYVLMLRARSYFPPAEGEVAGKPFPYAIAILIGTLVSLLWLSTGQ